MKHIPPECRRLAAELRTLRTRSGLSLAALGTESTYSKSSWERYLNGKALPPWPAVRALCRLANEPEPKVRALWELADSAWSGRGVVASSASASVGTEPQPVLEPLPQPESAPEPEPGPGPGPGPGPVPESESESESVAGGGPGHAARGPRRLRLGAAVVAGLLLSCAALTVAAAHEWDDGHGVVAARSSSPSSTATAFHVKCDGASCDGRDPTATLCGVQPETLVQVQTANGAGLEIRYNSLCRAAWARVWHTQVGDELTISVPGEQTSSVRVRDASSAETFVYTPMVTTDAKAAQLRACLTPPSGGAPQCFTARTP
jgi:transcriptional regulator with XRE-family HTH domain